MNALEVLLEEHEIILKAIDVLNRSAEILQKGRTISPKFFEEYLYVIRNFADKCHHGKEEAVLFPLIKSIRKDQDKIISSYLEDHEKGRGFIKGIVEGVNNNDVKSVINNAKGYANLLPLHIRKENAIFPTWITPLSEKTREELSERFEEIEEKVMGAGRHEEYIRNIERLNDYLRDK